MINKIKSLFSFRILNKINIQITNPGHYVSRLASWFYTLCKCVNTIFAYLSFISATTMCILFKLPTKRYWNNFQKACIDDLVFMSFRFSWSLRCDAWNTVRYCFPFYTTWKYFMPTRDRITVQPTGGIFTRTYLQLMEYCVLGIPLIYVRQVDSNS